MSPSLAQIAAYLDHTLGSERFPHEQTGVYHASSRPIKRIGLALEPWPGITRWIQQEQLDALFLHRSWSLEKNKLLENVGILSYHLAFDATLTFGFNQRLAWALQMTQAAPFAYKEFVPLGMHGAIKPGSLERILTTLTEIFGKAPFVQTAFVETVRHIAVVGAMTDVLIHEAAALGVELYVTGQFRQPAARAVQETRMTVAAIGHAEGEHWGLCALAGLLRERWAHLEVVFAPNP